MASTSSIRQRMKVFGSCGKLLGTVDGVEDGSIRLTRGGAADGAHHYIPLGWVEHVNQLVRLNRSCAEAREEWEPEPIGVWG